MEFPSPEISSYLYELTPARNALFKEMEELADETMFPAVGPLVGRFLYQLAHLAQAKFIFELGSGFGYSAQWFTMALPDNGQIICTELDKEKAASGLKFFERADQRHKVLYEIGDALEVFERYQGPFDLIFCDLDKERYPKVLELAVPRLRKGGLLVADNVLWSGRVLNEDDKTPSTRGIREFNQKCSQHPELFTTIIPLRDGISVSIKQ